MSKNNLAYTTDSNSNNVASFMDEYNARRNRREFRDVCAEQSKYKFEDIDDMIYDPAERYLHSER